MIIQPMVRNNICLNAHPAGCAEEVRLQVERAETFSARLRAGRPNARKAPKHVLVIGASTGYGLASRITASFGYGAPTVGFSFEREPQEGKSATPGWYATRAFESLAAARGLHCPSFNVDAFSFQAKELAVETARKAGQAYDLVIYSLASPVRTDPATGKLYRSVIKPIGRAYAGLTADVFTGRISESRAEPASETEIEETVKVMGGEDWELWMRHLSAAGVLAPGTMSLAYSYIGPPLSWPIYKDGTIGMAKRDLERASRSISASRPDLGLKAYVSINKAVVTRASAVIPVIPLYVSTLFKVMKERGLHEDCLDQALRLFSERLYGAQDLRSQLDSEGRIRIDDLEMGDAVQTEVSRRLERMDEAKLRELSDIDGFRQDFLRAHGFEVPGIDYSAEVPSYL